MFVDDQSMILKFLLNKNCKLIKITLKTKFRNDDSNVRIKYAEAFVIPFLLRINQNYMSKYLKKEK